MLKNLSNLTKPLKSSLSRWSALEKTFNSRPNTNLNLVKKDVGLFCVPELTCTEGFYNLTDKCVRKTDELINEVLNGKRTRKMVKIFDELSDTLCQVADLAEFIRFAHPSSNYSQAAENASTTVSSIVEKLNTNVELYKALKTTINSEQDVEEINEMDKFVGNLFLFDFEQSGIHLGVNEREIVVDLNNLILGLGQHFVSGVASPTVVKKVELPESVREVFSTDGDKAVISGLYADSPNPQIREIAYRIFLYPDSKQDKILTQLLQARHQLAQICGFQTYAERALRGSILEHPQNVMQLLNNLRDNISSKAQLDFNDMSKLKLSQTDRELAIWDVPYFTQKAKKERFSVTSQEYSPYFSLGACMEGLNLIFQALYGISLVNSELETGETWSKDVYKLAVTHENEGLLGYIYCDFYERNFKPNQDCHFTIRGGKIKDNGDYQCPIVVLMLNFQLPRWSSPTLLTPSMVDNLFHEMGHAMHSMLARTEYQHVSGTRCSTDFAEVPSILMEYFSSDYRVLKLFAKHFQTKEPISDVMLQRLCASKRLFTASETQLQIFYSALDQIFHGNALLDTTTKILADTQNYYYGLKYVTNTTWHLRFSHLVGYGAKYYSYLVSRALAHLIWRIYFRNDPLSRVQGEKYRRECLGFGGGKHPKLLVGDFLGIAPNADVLAKSILEEIDFNQSEVRNVLMKLGLE